MPITTAQVQQLAHECGFEIAGVTAAVPNSDYARFQTWHESGKAADLNYLTDYRANLRSDPRLLLPAAQSIICLGKLYNTDRPLSIETVNPAQGWISRYAWGLDYHEQLRPPLETLLQRLTELHGELFESKICIDTAPLLERSYARAAGLGWIGKNTCLINQRHGSWFFLAELLVALPLVPSSLVPDRCGTCTRCISACPTDAIIPNPMGGFDLDAGLCISYLTIEKRGTVSSDLAAQTGSHLFGCDICQDVCPWNQRAHRQEADLSSDKGFAAQLFAPDLEDLANLAEEDFRERFRHTPIWRAKYTGFLRNVAIAMGNSGRPSLREPLTRLTQHANAIVSETATEALARLELILQQDRESEAS